MWHKYPTNERGSQTPSFDSDIIKTTRGQNEFNKEEAIQGHYNNGKLTNSTNHSTNFIPCEANENFTCTGVSGYTNFWDGNKVFVEQTILPAGTKSITIPNNNQIKYVTFTLVSSFDRFVIVRGDTLPLEYRPYNMYSLNNKVKTSRLNGKVWNVLGDSITEGYSTGSYHQIIAYETGVLVNNYGIGGTRIADSGGNEPMVYRYSQMDDNADIITVLGGTNDFGRTTLGTLGSTDPTTFYGACDLLFKGLIEKYPTKGIGIMTPLPWLNDSGLESFANAIKEVAKKYRLPVLDLYNMAGLNPNIQIINDQLFRSADGLHPNSEGFKVIAPKIQSFLESL